MVTVVNTVLLGEQILKVLITRKKKKFCDRVMWTCVDHFTTYTNLELRCYTPETHVLYVNYTTINPHKTKQKKKIIHSNWNKKSRVAHAPEWKRERLGEGPSLLGACFSCRGLDAPCVVGGKMGPRGDFPRL